MPNYEYVTSPTRAEQIAKELLRETHFGYDLETTGLDPHTDSVLLAAIATRKANYVIDTRDRRCMEALRAPLESEAVKKLGFYLMFDSSMTKGYAGIDVEEPIDLQLAEKCLTAGLQYDGFSLEAVTKKYLGKERDKSLQKSFVGHKGEFSKEQLKYAAEDAADLLPLFDVMSKKVRSEGLENTWDIENGAIPSFTDIYFYGQKIDVEKWRQIMEENKVKIADAEVDLQPYFDPFFERDLFGNLDVNFNSQKQTLYGLQRMGITVDGALIKDTADATRKKVRDLPVIQALGRHREALKAYGTYGQPYLDAIHHKTGRIHPRIGQLDTASGRPSCGKPNVLNIPRDVRYRHAFVTDHDRLISTVDFSGAELRIMADQSGDELMIRGFNAGVDFHCYTATMLFNKPEIISKKDPLRTPTKTLSFGLAYGMGVRRLYEQLNGMGYKISVEECRDLFMKYKSTFKTVIAWLDSNKREARKQRVMTNVAGRKRWWDAPNEHKIRSVLRAELLKKAKRSELTSPEESRLNELVHEKANNQWAAIEREGANFKVQSTNVEWTKLSMKEIRKTCKRKGYDARMYNSVYDETVLDVHKNCAQEVHELQKKIMIECGQRYCSKVPVEVEGHLEPYWTK